jgi:hypothetical protein
MEAVQFHPGLKPFLQPRHDLIAQERLSPVRKHRHNHSQHSQRRQQPAPNPPEPAVSAPERSLNCRQTFLPFGSHFRRIRLRPMR